MSALNEAVDVLERVLCARYNVRSTEGLGALGEAVAAARGGDVTDLERAMAGREMYRWSDEASEALAAVRAAAVKAPKPAPVAQPVEEEPEPVEAEDETSEEKPRRSRR